MIKSGKWCAMISKWKGGDWIRKCQKGWWERWKNIDDAEKNAMVWKKFLVKKIFLFKKCLKKWTSNQKYNEKKYGGYNEVILKKKKMKSRIECIDRVGKWGVYECFMLMVH